MPQLLAPPRAWASSPEQAWALAAAWAEELVSVRAAVFAAAVLVRVTASAAVVALVLPSAPARGLERR